MGKCPKEKGIKVNLILGPVEKEIGILESIDFPIIYPENLQELVHSLMSAKFLLVTTLVLDIWLPL